MLSCCLVVYISCVACSAFTALTLRTMHPKMWNTPGVDWEVQRQEPPLAHMGQHSGHYACAMLGTATPAIQVHIVAHLQIPIKRFDDVLAGHGHVVGLHLRQHIVAFHLQK